MKNRSITIVSSWKCDFYLLICIVAALLMIGIYLMEMTSWPSAYIGGHDSRSYDYVNSGTDMASYVKEGRGVLDATWPVIPFYRAPFYSFLLAPVLFVKDSIVAVVIFQMILVIFTLVFTYQLGKEFFDDQAGFCATLLLLLYGGYIFYAAVPLSTITEAFFATFSLYTICRFRKNFSFLNAVVAGGVGALVCMTRPNYLAIFPLALFFVCLEYWGLKKESYRKAIQYFLLSGIIFLVLIAPPVIWNNYRNTDGGVILLNTNGGPTYRLSNSYDSTVYNFIYPKKELMPVYTVAFWKHQFRKALAYWTSIEYPQNVNLLIYRQHSVILKLLFINFGFIAALYLAACVYFYRRFLLYWPLYLYSGLYILSIIAFYIVGRFRIPAVPAMVVLGGAFAVEVFQKIREKKVNMKEKRLVAALAVFLLVFVYSTPWQTTVNPPVRWINLALRQKRDLDLPGYRESHLELMLLLPQDFRYPLYYLAAAAFEGRFKEAQHYISMLKKHSNVDPLYLRRTEQDLNVLQAVMSGKSSKKAWIEYVAEKKCGHIALFYIELSNFFAERRRNSLPVEKDFSPLF